MTYFFQKVIFGKSLSKRSTPAIDPAFATMYVYLLLHGLLVF